MKRKTFLIQSGKAILGSTAGGALYSLAASGSREEAEGRNQSSGDSLKLFLGGDVMTGRGIDQVLPHSVNPTLHERYVKNALQYVKLAERKHGSIPGQVSYEYIWGDALEELKRISPDARIINLETAVTTSDDYWKGKGVHYRMHPQNTPLLTGSRHRRVRAGK